MPRLYDPLLLMVYADEAVQALLKGDLVTVIVNQNNTNTHTHILTYQLRQCSFQAATFHTAAVWGHSWGHEQPPPARLNCKIREPEAHSARSVPEGYRPG